MRRLSLIAASLLSVLPIATAGAQAGRADERARDTWDGDAPQVRVWIDGARALAFGEPVQVHYWVSEDAYVIIATVDPSGRLTILQPRTRTGRTFVRGDIEQVVLGRQTSVGTRGAFYISRGGPYSGGYVFAIASWQPFDLSSFESRDFDTFGLDSHFSLANRAIAGNPDEYVQRFASAVTWDASTSYDYDVDYYSSSNTATYASASSLCFAGSHTAYLWSDWYGNPYGNMCPGYFSSLAFCYGFSVYSYSPYCGYFYRPSQITSLPATPTVPTGSHPDSSIGVNVGVIRGGLWAPDTVGAIVDEPGGVQQQKAGAKSAKADALAPFTRQATQPSYFAIPDRGIRMLKEPGSMLPGNDKPDTRSFGTGVSDAKHGATGADGGAETPKVVRSSTKPVMVAPPTRVQPKSMKPARRPVYAAPGGTTGSSSGTSRPSGSTRDPYAMPRARQPASPPPSSAKPAGSSGDVRQGAGAAKPAATTTKPKKPPQ